MVPLVRDCVAILSLLVYIAEDYSLFPTKNISVKLSRLEYYCFG